MSANCDPPEIAQLLARYVVNCVRPDYIPEPFLVKQITFGIWKFSHLYHGCLLSLRKQLEQTEGTLL